MADPATLTFTGLAGTKDRGDEVRLTFTVQDSAAVKVDPTGVKLEIKRPTGIVTALVFGTDGALIKDAVGIYHSDIVLDQQGTWAFRASVSGTFIAAEEITQDVRTGAFQ